VSTATSGLHVLRLLLAHRPADHLVVSESDPLRSVIERVQHANGEGTRGALEDALKDVPGRDDLIALILSGDPDAPPAQPRAKLWAAPELPVAAQPTREIAASAGEWMDVYVKHANSISPMTPRPFHESAALWLAATAISRRLVVPMPYGNVHPNLMILWIATTTIFHKTTAMDVARNLARDLFPHLLAPQDVTPEALLADMAGISPTKLEDMPEAERKRWNDERNFAGQRSMMIDEASGLMSSAGRDYMAGLIEMLLKFYDCDPSYTRSTKSQGRVTIKSSSLSALMASTPRAMAPHLGSDRLWAMGWWPRFAILSPDVEQPKWEKATHDGRPPGDPIVWPLQKLYERLPTATWPDQVKPITVTLGPGVFEKWDIYHKAVSYDLLRPDRLDERMFGTYGRLATQALKVATILAALEWARTDDLAPVIELRHLHRAIEITETWRISAHLTLDQSATAEENNKLTRLIRQIGRHGLEGATMRDLTRSMRDIPSTELRKLIEHAVSTEEVVCVKSDRGPKGGQPGTHYRIPIE